jgi:hypothetical protein
MYICFRFELLLRIVTPIRCSCELRIYVHKERNKLGPRIMKSFFSGGDFDLYILIYVDWAGDRISRRCTTGYVVFAAGGPIIIWSSKLQTTGAISIMESEYLTMYGGMQELVWIRGGV